MAEPFTCSHCGQECSRSELQEFNGQLLCPECLDELTVECDDCGSRVLREVVEFADQHTRAVCPACVSRHYTYCERCGCLVNTADLYFLDDSDDGYCESCYRAEKNRRVIQSYYYKPDPIFYGKGDRFFGVELEIDEGGERDAAAGRLMDIANVDREHIYCKHDGSLSDGFEIVTHPMTLQYHMTEMPWAQVLSEAVHMGYASHQTKTCGLHVHVNRDSFGETEQQQEDVIARILFFVENHWNELLKFSRRSEKLMEQWSARYGRKDDPKAVLDNAKDSNLGRYACVNLTNYHTIEFRMFRGTLKLNTFLATLQMVERICDVAFSLSDRQMQELTWTEFVSGCTQPELVQYLKERRLYVNEPVVAEEEV